MGEWRIEWWEKEEPHDSSESMRREGGIKRWRIEEGWGGYRR